MREPTETRQADHPDVIASRYRVQKVLGVGGMGIVYEVCDLPTGQKLALKRTRPQNDSDVRMSLEEFEREFHTLAHLAHPRVIEVYDYGVDDSGPYYTMELLDGGDLRELSPMDWREACQLFLEVCSALCLLHSRRMVHRDISPRNLRCTAGGEAKLIDFGAMMPMGICKQLVGTPPCVAPEMLGLEKVDGRTDLYALGCTLYYALTGRHAYRARDFGDLRTRWGDKPPLPSELVSGIPKALDGLVMSLIHLDPSARPATAAEVMERLSAIAEIQVHEHLLVSQAYLSTPILVGREQASAYVRRQLRRAARGRGSALMVQGASGVGRTRFMDTCVVQGKLAGATVLRADASDAGAGDYAAVRALSEQLLRASPKRALNALRPVVGVLGHVFPQLLEQCSDIALESIDDPSQLRPRVQAAFRQWLLETSRHELLLLVVDDLHRVDEPSAALVAFVGHGAAEHSVAVTVSAETKAPRTSEAAFELLSEYAGRVELKDLTLPETESLLGSVFGEVPNLQLVARHVHRISLGNPRDVMQLAQHLVDCHAVEYRAGVWSLPDHIDAADLPAGMAQALLERVRALSADARVLAQTMALSSEQSFSFEECLSLTGHGDTARLMKSLDELLAAGVVVGQAGRYSMGQRGWVTALKTGGEPEQQKAFHLRLARVFQQRGGEQFLVGRHLMQAGEAVAGLDAFVEHAELAAKGSDEDPEFYFKYLQSQPSDWVQTFREAFDLLERLNRPRIQWYLPRRVLAALQGPLGGSDLTYLNDPFRMLERDCGLASYRELDDTMEDSARLGRALQLAQERYDRSSEHDRGMAPLAGIRELSRLIMICCGVLAVSLDLAFLEGLPSLRAFVPLSPALDVVDKLVRMLGHRLAGRYDLAAQGYQEILHLLAQPDGAGLEPTYREYVRFGVLRAQGMIQASAGMASALETSSQLAKDPRHEIHALHIQMLYHLWQGDVGQSEQCRKTAALLKVQKTSTELFEGSYLGRELVYYGLAEDLSGVRRCIRVVKKMAARFPAWVPILHYARGEYQRIRGSYQAAAAELRQAMELAGPGRHQNWVDIVAAYLRTLLELGEYEGAKTLAEESLRAAEREQLGYTSNYLKMPMALAQAELGDCDSAATNAESVIEDFKSSGVTGLSLGLAYETRARIAIRAEDLEGFHHYLRLYAKRFCRKADSGLNAKYGKLLRDAEDPVRGLTELQRGGVSASAVGSDQSDVSSALAACGDFQERSRRALEMLGERSHAAGGFLYLLDPDGLSLVAQVGFGEPPQGIEAIAAECLESELADSGDGTKTAESVDSVPGSTFLQTENGDKRFLPVLLGHYAEDGYRVTGVAVLAPSDSDGLEPSSVLSAEISEALADFGDVAFRLATD